MKNFDRTAVRLILSFGLAWICAGCESRLEAALELAGENRPELEAVLQHYSTDKADSLKYRAARFLIENLPLHYGYAGKGLEDFKCDYDSLFCDKDIPRQVLRGRAKNYNPDFTNVHPAFDLSELSRDFLIRHIDNAFATLDYPWTKGLSFGDFCEYVLPYRIENELAEDWMPHYRDFLAEIIRPLQQSGADRYTAARTIQDSLRRMDYEVIDESVMRMALRPSDYLRAAGGACPEITSLMWYALRSVGLPVNYDYIIQWANRSQSHSWNSLRVDSVLYSFGMSDPEFGKHFESRPQERVGKVYRKMFSFQPQSLPNQRGALAEGIPPAFRSPFIKDVSESYFDGIDLAMKLTIPIAAKKKFAYLVVFDNRNWVPVAWSRIKRGRVAFDHVEKGCAYMVMYYDRGLLLPATDPFTVSKEGGVAVRKPDGAEVSVTLKRKYPVFFELEFILNGEKRPVPGCGQSRFPGCPDCLRYARGAGSQAVLRATGRQHNLPVYTLSLPERCIREYGRGRVLCPVGGKARRGDNRNRRQLREFGRRQIQIIRRGSAHLFQCPAGIPLLGRHGFRPASDPG